jgi:hypothetical protein
MRARRKLALPCGSKVVPVVFAWGNVLPQIEVFSGAIYRIYNSGGSLSRQLLRSIYQKRKEGCQFIINHR